MAPNDQTAIVVNAFLNFLNLALTAWILTMTKSTKARVTRNSRTTRRTARKIEQVKTQTDGQLTKLLELLEKAGINLAKTNERVAEVRRGGKAKPKPPPRKK